MDWDDGYRRGTSREFERAKSGGPGSSAHDEQDKDREGGTKRDADEDVENRRADKVRLLEKLPDMVLTMFQKPRLESEEAAPKVREDTPEEGEI